MTETETETTLCQHCQTPVEVPQLYAISPFLAYKPIPLCKTCLYDARAEHFRTRHQMTCPYREPHWRPRCS